VLGNCAGGSDVRGGVSGLTGDLTGVELGSLEIDGGVSKPALRLGKARRVRARPGPSPGERRRRGSAGRYVIEIHGGASKLTLDTDAA
jgi:hypothetical protein